MNSFLRSLRNLVPWLAAALMFGAASSAQAVINIDIRHVIVGENAKVVALVSGSANLDGLNYEWTKGADRYVGYGNAWFGDPYQSPYVDVYSGIQGPVTFPLHSASNQTPYVYGDMLGLTTTSSYGQGIYLPAGYQSGDRIVSVTAWWGPDAIGTLFTPGVYEWTWGEGASADSMVMRVTSLLPVPEPATWATLAAGLALVGQLSRRRRT